MPYEFRKWERELEPQAASGRSGIPPGKFVGTGVLDRPVPPKRPLLRILVGLILAAIIASVVWLFFAYH